MTPVARWKTHGLLLLVAAAICFLAARDFATARPEASEYMLVGALAAFLMFAFISSVTLAMTRSTLVLLLHLGPALLGANLLRRWAKERPPPVAAAPTPPAPAQPVRPAAPVPPPRAQAAPGWERSPNLASFRVRAVDSAFVVTVVSHFTGPLSIAARHPQIPEFRYGDVLCEVRAEETTECELPLREPKPVTAAHFELGISERKDGQVTVVQVDEAGEGRPTR